MIYNVRNLHENRPGNWIRYWENATNLKAGTCHFYGCSEAATDGAHVKLVDANDNRWFIVPLCHMHNCQFGDTFFVKGPLVSVSDPTVILP